MAEIVEMQSQKAPARFFLRRWWDAIISNPVIAKEFRSRMRGNRAFVILTVHVLFLSIIVGSIFLLFWLSQNSLGPTNTRQNLGKSIFLTVVATELVIISFTAPALTAGAIAAERERQTFDILRTTMLSSRALVFGKLISAVAFIVLLLASSIPLQSMAFLFGGVSAGEVFVSNLILLTCTLLYSAVGIFFSSFSRRTLVSTVLSYGFTTLLIFGLPMLISAGLGIFGAITQGFYNKLTPTAEVILLGLVYVLIAVNPLATGLVTEVILSEEQQLFLFDFPLTTGSTIKVLSPWILFTVIYLGLSLLLIGLSIRIVRRPEK